METQRNLFLIAWIFLSLMLWQAWVNDHAPLPVSQPTASVGSIDSNISENQQRKLIIISSDVLSLTVNLSGGDIEQADLLNYKKSLGSTESYSLLENSASYVHVAQSGLVGRDGPDDASNKTRPLYTVENTEYILADGQDELRIPLTYKNENTGAVYTKTYILQRDKYVVNVEYHINNTSDKPLQVQMYGQLKQSTQLPKERDSSGGMTARAYHGAAYSSDENKYKKYDFSDIADEPLKVATQSGWVAMLQQYFATAWIPSSAGPNEFYSRNIASQGLAIIGFRGTPAVIQPGATEDFSARLWVGPELQDEMAEVTNHLDLTVDYGWLWFLSQPMFKLLKFFQSLVGNWGVAIIMVTLVVRGVMYPLTKAQYTSTAKMKLLQPKLQEMRERFGEDRQRMSQEMMELYKKEKVNPLGGCFILLLQMPIFISLYYMLIASVELRHMPFFGWLTDLSARDPYYILPLFMGGTMFLIQKMSPTPVTDPMQKKIMTFMPVIFTGLFLWFPSGLVLYYTMSNLFTIIQQELIYRGLEKKGLHERAAKKSKK